jgi:hypothetical protein
MMEKSRFTAAVLTTPALKTILPGDRLVSAVHTCIKTFEPVQKWRHAMGSARQDVMEYVIRIVFFLLNHG